MKKPPICFEPRPVASSCPAFEPSSERNTFALSLIVCSIGRTDKLSRLANSLALQSWRDFELVLVDQAEPGVVDQFVADLPFWLTVSRIRTPRGLSRGRNAGLRVARGAIIALPDDDAWLPNTLVADVIAHFESSPQCAFICGVTRDATGNLSNGTFLGRQSEIDRTNVFRSGNSNAIFVRIEAMRAVGGFNESLGVGAGTPFGAGEETDLMLRLLQAGESGLFLPELMVHHDQISPVQQKLNGEAFLQRATTYAQGYGRVLRLHGYSRFFVLWKIFRNIGALILALLRVDIAEARRRWRWVTGIARGYWSKV
ncbi:glycosyltransferase family 2 protein [Pseudoroseicyclus sp. CXY001]|uniref:glycosyltransferase family 2 protein n=1 Tax=Pseudoroseicyclus sp. CXY001 TaxID=3242492 RepID=UPI003570A843